MGRAQSLRWVQGWFRGSRDPLTALRPGGQPRCLSLQGGKCWLQGQLRPADCPGVRRTGPVAVCAPGVTGSRDPGPKLGLLLRGPDLMSMGLGREGAEQLREGQWMEEGPGSPLGKPAGPGAASPSACPSVRRQCADRCLG